MRTIVFLGLLLFLGCRQKPASTGETARPVALPAPDWTIRQVADEERLLLRLAPIMTGTPRNMVEEGRNAVAEYALTHKWDVQATRTGLLYQVVEAGQGPEIQWGDRLAAHYEGRFFDGKVFDSTYERGAPLTFYVGNMVPGWNEGLQKLRVGSKAVLVVPAHLAYGAQGLSDGRGGYLVPPEQNLVFRIHVLEQLSPAGEKEG